MRIRVEVTREDFRIVYDMYGCNILSLILFTNPSARSEYDTKSILSEV